MLPGTRYSVLGIVLVGTWPYFVHSYRRHSTATEITPLSIPLANTLTLSSQSLSTRMASEYPDGEEEDVPPAIADLAQASVPSSLRGIRACKRCGILKTLDQFLNEGCENCPFLDMVRACVRACLCVPF